MVRNPNPSKLEMHDQQIMDDVISGNLPENVGLLKCIFSIEAFSLSITGWIPVIPFLYLVWDYVVIDPRLLVLFAVIHHLWISIKLHTEPGMKKEVRECLRKFV